MPIDKPKAGETQDKYLEYCVPLEIKAGKPQDQAVAICISTYRKDKMSKLRTSEERVLSKLKYSQDFRGINLTNFGINSEACWDNYIQVGTKIVDGREVPDCRGPVEAMEEGVPHYTADGKLYEGPTHKDASGRLMTGEVHTEDSEFLYHRDDLEVQPQISSTYPGQGPVTGSK